MKSKKIILIFITIIIAISIIVTMFVVRNSMAKDKIKSKIKLSEEEKSSLNYEQLIEDIKSLEDGHGVKYAKKQERQSTGNKIEDIINAGNDFISDKGELYIGDGYVISHMTMPEMIEYDFCTKDNKLIYSIQNGVPLESLKEHNERMIKENSSNIIFYGAIAFIKVVTLVIFIVFYIYYINLKQLFKNKKNIIKGTVIQKEYINPFIKKHILSVKINENEEERIIKTNYYGSAVSAPVSGNEIKLVKGKNNKYENNYNFYNLRMCYISTAIGVPVAIAIAVALKFLLPK